MKRILVFLFSIWIFSVNAQTEYPAKPIRLIVQFTPGTSTDIIGRLVAQKFTETWGQPVIVDNRPGAGAIIGTEAAAKAPPDGYTLVMAVSSAFGINPGLVPNLPYDVMRDFALVSNVVMTPQTLVVPGNSAAKSVQELVAQAKAKPGALNYGSLGSGSTSHLTMELFRATAGIQLTHVPYKGSPPAYTDLFSGNIQLMFDAVPAVLPHAKSGKLRALAVGSSVRSPFMPDVPTVAESGYPGFEAVGWIGLAAPAKTPEAVLNKINAEVVKILATQDMKERLAGLGVTPVGDTRAQFTAFVRSEIAKWGKLIKDAGVKAD
jgi:tripartite-type tricarboxylate transporter receptor subunit TctC